MTHSIRKIGALVMAVAMCFSLAVTASAAATDPITMPASGDLRVLKDGASNVADVSMSNDAFQDGYTTEIFGDNVKVYMPLTTIVKLGLKGHITSDTTAMVNNNNVTVSVEGSYVDNSATLVLSIPTSALTAVNAPGEARAVKVDIHFGISLGIKDSHNNHTSMKPNADMYLYL